MNSTRLSVSIIVPVYNSDKWLRRCIDSILAQNHRDFELILVNDGSSDLSPQICREYEMSDKRIKFITQENGGAAKARNTGIKKAINDYICFIDSDDYVGPDYISSNLAAIEKSHADMSISGRTQLHLDGKKNIITPDADIFQDTDITRIFENTSVSPLINSPCGKMFHKGIIEKNNISFPEKVRYLEDSIFVLKYILSCKRIVTVRSNEYFYENHPSSLVFTLNSFEIEKAGYDTFSEVHRDFIAGHTLSGLRNRWFTENRLFMFYRVLGASQHTNSLKEKLQRLESMDWEFFREPVHPDAIGVKIRNFILNHRLFRTFILLRKFQII